MADVCGSLCAGLRNRENEIARVCGCACANARERVCVYFGVESELVRVNGARCDWGGKDFSGRFSVPHFETMN